MKGDCGMYEAPSVERVFVDAEELMNGILDSGNKDWTDNERSIDLIFD